MSQLLPGQLIDRGVRLATNSLPVPDSPLIRTTWGEVEMICIYPARHVSHGGPLCQALRIESLFCNGQVYGFTRSIEHLILRQGEIGSIDGGSGRDLDQQRGKFAACEPGCVYQAILYSTGCLRERGACQ